MKKVTMSNAPAKKLEDPKIKIGIVGTGRIAGRFIPEADFVSGIEVISAYNPHKGSVERFSERFGIRGYCKEYAEFLNGVDAVYVASLHQTHYEYAKLALLQGKHVLCEKPMAMTETHARELFMIAKEQGCLLMEAIKTAYCPGFQKLLEVAGSGVIGNIVDVEACFTRIADPNLRERTDTNYGGGFLEFGNHTLLPIFKLMGTAYKEIHIHSVRDEQGIDQYTKITFSFENGMALSKTGVAVKSEGQLIIAGTKGYILAESPWWLTRHFEVRYENPFIKEEYSAEFLGDGLRYEISEFVSLIHDGKRKSSRFTEEESIAMSGVVEKFMEMRR